MKICIFLPDLGGGGAERMMVNVAHGLCGLGCEVRLVLAGKDYGHFNTDDLNVIEFGFSRTAFALPRLQNFLGHWKPDILLSTISHANIIAIIASKMTRPCPVVVVREATNVSRRIGHGRRHSAVLWLQRFFYPMADKVVAVSDGVKSEVLSILKVPDEMVVTVPNPVVNQEMMDSAETEIEFPWKDRNAFPVIIAAGRMVPEKDFPNLLKAVSIVRKKLRVRLVILGDGPSRSELEALAQKLDFGQDILMPGYLSNPYPWIKGANLFVLSSRVEGAPNVLVEAIALGVPVVATDCNSGPREILRDGLYGPLVPVAEPIELAAAIETQLGQSFAPGAPAVIDRFGTSSVAKRYLDLFETLLMLL